MLGGCIGRGVKRQERTGEAKGDGMGASSPEGAGSVKLLGDFIMHTAIISLICWNGVRVDDGAEEKYGEPSQVGGKSRSAGVKRKAYPTFVVGVGV